MEPYSAFLPTHTIFSRFMEPTTEEFVLYTSFITFSFMLHKKGVGTLNVTGWIVSTICVHTMNTNKLFIECTYFVFFPYI